MRTAALAIAGGVVGGAAGFALRRRTPARRHAAAGRGLVVAAVVYVAGRRPRASSGKAVVQEVAALAGTAGLAAVASRAQDSTARVLLATGWAAHAGFDLAHTRDAGSLVPDWYPPLCAGFDVGLAAVLLFSPDATWSLKSTELLRWWRDLPPVDPQSLRADIDAVLDPEL